MAECDYFLATFTKNIKSMKRLRQKSNEYVSGRMKIEKIMILSKGKYEKLAKNISPEYAFLKENRKIMSAAGGRFHSLLVTTKKGPEGIFFAQGIDDLYVCRCPNIHYMDLRGIPVERISLESKIYQDEAYFVWMPNCLSQLKEAYKDREAFEGIFDFKIEEVVVLSDKKYRRIKKGYGISQEYKFIKKHKDQMWYDYDNLWHCLLIKGETSKDGILVDTERGSHIWYAAYVPDCDRLRLQNVPVDYQYLERSPEKPLRQKGVDAR